MADNQKAGPARPPPLPPTPPASSTPRASVRPGTAARVKAFITIRRIRIEASARRAWEWARRRRLAVSLVAAAVLLVAGVGVAYEIDALPDVFGPKTIADARQKARAHPTDAVAQRDLGHLLWSSRRRHAAVSAYGRALSIDPACADEKTAENLVAAFGTREQATAEAVIWKHKVVGAQKGLESLVRSRRHSVRWAAVHTLDKLEKGTKANWETAYILDLDSRDCDTRRRAVEKLGAIGSRRSVAALRSAKAEDAKTGGWFHQRCLGDRLEDAEQKILARR